MSESVSKLKNRLYEVNALRTACALMEWDQQCYMPHGGGAARAEHLGILSKLSHEMFTSDETRGLLENATKDAEGIDADLVRVTQRQFDLATKLPTALVAEKTRLGAEGHEKWVVARKTNDFKTFAPILKRMFEIAGEEANYLGYKDHVYDALLDQYEQGATASDCRTMFDALRGPQVALVKEIASLGEVDDSPLHGTWDQSSVSAFTLELVNAIGFDLKRGRQDVAPHPFCTNFSVGDVRLTTRFGEYLPSPIFGSLHEAGHGVYEQGSPMEWDRTPLAGGVSLGLHESQSRFWENIVGRSTEFWSHFLPSLQGRFSSLSGLSLKQFVKMVNKVSSSYIRVEADELTYNLHVMVRFEIECDVLTGKLAVADLPEAWNAKYEEYLGIRPTSDSVGCLQDVHWSGGMIGYFPTYSMGNVLSYQIWNALQRDIPNAQELIAQGSFEPIHGWLLEKIYRQVQPPTPKDLVLAVTGKPMDPTDYLAGLSAKYRGLYDLG